MSEDSQDLGDGLDGADGEQADGGGGAEMIDTSEFAADFGAETVAESHRDAEGIEGETAAQDLGSAEKLKEMLLSTEPDERLSEVESPWDPEKGGLTRLWRGIRKMGAAPGMPAIGDVLIGMAEMAHTYQLEGQSGGSSEEPAGGSGGDQDAADGLDPITAAAISDED